MTTEVRSPYAQTPEGSYVVQCDDCCRWYATDKCPWFTHQREAFERDGIQTVMLCSWCRNGEAAHGR